MVMQSKLKLILLGSATFLLGIVVGVEALKAIIKSMSTDDEFIQKNIIPIIEKELRKAQSEQTKRQFNVFFTSKSDAEDVLLDFYKLLKTNKVVSVSDLCDIISLNCVSDIAPNPEYSDWGWTDITNSTILETKDGRYKLCLPSAELIK
jgi:hypothetical protein